MKTHLIANAFTNIDDQYIIESHPAAVLAQNGRLPRAEGPVRRFLGSGWGAAILSAACALLVLTGIVMAGRMGTGDPTVNPGGQVTEAEADNIRDPSHTLTAGSFSFAYRIEAPAGYERGATITVFTEMTNITDKTITAQGSSGDREAHIRLLYEDGTDTVNIAPILCYTANVVPHTFKPGETVKGQLQLRIPEDAPYGAYTLELSYPYNAAWTVSFENVFTLRSTPTTPSLTLTLDGVEHPLRGGHIITGSLSRDIGDCMGEHIDMDGMPPEKLEDILLSDCGSAVPYTKGNALQRMKLDAIRMSEGTATWESIKVYDTSGKLVRNGVDSISCGLSDDVYYAVLLLRASGFSYAMGDKTYTVEDSIIMVVFRLVSPDYEEETTPTTPTTPVTTTPPSTEQPPVALPDVEPFMFEYDIKAPNGYAPGESVSIHVAMTNCGEETLFLEGPSSDHKPRIRLYAILPDGTEQRLDEELDSTDDIVKHIYSPRETVDALYDFRIPNNAPTGKGIRYRLEIYSPLAPIYGVELLLPNHLNE